MPWPPPRDLHLALSPEDKATSRGVRRAPGRPSANAAQRAGMPRRLCHGPTVQPPGLHRPNTSAPPDGGAGAMPVPVASRPA